jgi:hypothetical protein
MDTPRILGLTGQHGDIKTLYHQTNAEFSKIIEDNQIMKIGRKGMLGAGIYFAETAAETRGKARQEGVMIEAQVIVGIQLRVKGAWNDMNLNFIQQRGAETVRGEGYRTGVEYVIYEPDRIVNIRIISGADSNSICTNPRCFGFLTNHRGQEHKLKNSFLVMYQGVSIFCQAQLPGYSTKFQIFIDSNSSVEELKRKVAERFNANIHQFSLVSGGLQLLDKRSIKSYHMRPAQIVFVVSKLQGG